MHGSKNQEIGRSGSTAVVMVFCNEQLLRHILTQHLDVPEQLRCLQAVCALWRQVIRTQRHVKLKLPDFKPCAPRSSCIKAFLGSVRSCFLPDSIESVEFRGHVVDDADLGAIAEHSAGSIVEVDLGGCPRITEEGLRALSICSRLRYLSVKGCRHINGAFLESFEDRVSRMRRLDLSFTMTSLAAVTRVLRSSSPGPKLLPSRGVDVVLNGTPAVFELTYQYDRREELESLLLRLQMAINSANVADTRDCLIAGSRMPPLWASDGKRSAVRAIDLLLAGPFTDYYVSSLMLGAFVGCEKLVKLLLDLGADVQGRAVGMGTCLHIACRVNYLGVAKLLLDNGADPRAKTQNGSAPLHTVVSHQGHPELAALLLERGGVVDAQAHDGITALHMACQKGHIDMVKLLLDRKADVSLLTCNGLSTLIYAAHYGHDEIVRLLLDRDAPDVQDSCGARALHHATQAGHGKVVELLLKRGWDVHAGTATGKTPLQCAAFEGHADIVEMLLEHGADAEALTSKGRSALYYASRNGHVTVVKLLIEHCKRRSARPIVDEPLDLAVLSSCAPADKRAALHSACRKGHMLVVKSLMETWDADRDGDVADDQGHGPLHISAEFGRDELVRYLALTLPVNGSTQRGQTALHYASWKGFDTVVDFLLTVGCDIDAQNTSGRTSLQGACHKGHERVVRLLLKRGAQVNIAAHDGHTALVHAALKGRLAIVSILLENGASAHARTIRGLTAADIARQAGHHDVKRALVVAEAAGAAIPRIGLRRASTGSVTGSKAPRLGSKGREVGATRSAPPSLDTSAQLLKDVGDLPLSALGDEVIAFLSSTMGDRQPTNAQHEEDEEEERDSTIISESELQSTVGYADE